MLKEFHKWCIMGNFYALSRDWWRHFSHL